jgi:S1-C subfamily serine protease
MPDPSTEIRAGRDQNGLSRVCSACDRRVPRNVTTCRCGAELPPGTDTFPAEPAAEAKSASLPVMLAVAAIALAGVGYWALTRPAPASTQVESSQEAEESASGADDATPRAVSPEARAWDAAANAQPAAAPTPAQAGTPATTAQVPAPAGVSASIEDVVDRVMPAVVLIEATSGRGSGFYISHDTLITNVHVVKEDGYVTLRRHDGTTVNARVEKRAPAFDIAVLKVAQPQSSQVVIPMGSARSLKPGQEIVVIGSALGTLRNTVSRGVVSGLRSSGGATLVQTDAATNPGNSGGPMLDRNGSVIGITTMGYRGAEGLNFGVAIDHARDLVEGRQTNLGTQSGLTNIQPMTDAPESDRLQQQGEEQVRGRVGQLKDAAASLDGAWQRFRQQCYTSPIPGNYDREWFAMLAPRGLPSDAGNGCASYYAAMDSDIKQFKGLMQRAVVDARRANVLPGTIRDVLRSNRLDFDWER